MLSLDKFLLQFRSRPFVREHWGGQLRFSRVTTSAHSSCLFWGQGLCSLVLCITYTASLYNPGFARADGPGPAPPVLPGAGRGHLSPKGAEPQRPPTGLGAGGWGAASELRAQGAPAPGPGGTLLPCKGWSSVPVLLFSPPLRTLMSPPVAPTGGRPRSTLVAGTVCKRGGPIDRLS